MKEIKIFTMLTMLLLAIGVVGATDVKMSWEGDISSVYGNIDNGESDATFEGGGDYASGDFEADDDNYGKVEVDKFEATANDGHYIFEQNNDNQNGKGMVGLYGGSDDVVNVFAKTDEWRRGNSLSATRYSGSWPGTEHPVVESTGNYNIGVAGKNDKDKDGNVDSSFSVDLSGEGYGGVGTEKAGSDSVVHVGEKVSAKNDVVRTDGSGNLNHDSNNANVEYKHYFN